MKASFIWCKEIIKNYNYLQKLSADVGPLPYIKIWIQKFSITLYN